MLIQADQHMRTVPGFKVFFDEASGITGGVDGGAD
jgi:hypothetical protein